MNLRTRLYAFLHVRVLEETLYGLVFVFLSLALALQITSPRIHNKPGAALLLAGIFAFGCLLIWAGVASKEGNRLASWILLSLWLSGMVWVVVKHHATMWHDWETYPGLLMTLLALRRYWRRANGVQHHGWLGHIADD